MTFTFLNPIFTKRGFLLIIVLGLKNGKNEGVSQDALVSQYVQRLFSLSSYAAIGFVESFHTIKLL